MDATGRRSRARGVDDLVDDSDLGGLLDAPGDQGVFLGELVLDLGADLGMHLGELAAVQDPYGRDRLLRNAAHGDVTYIDVIDTLCGQVCDAYNGGKIMYFDRDHLSLDGVNYLLNHGVYRSFVENIEHHKSRTIEH